MARQTRNRADAQRTKRKRLHVSFYSIAVIAVGLAVWGALSVLGGSGSAGSITVVATDFSFAPGLIESVPGQIDITLDNQGPAGHELAVLKQGVHIESRPEFEPWMMVREIHWTAPGESASDTFTLEPGTYQVVCLIPGHLEAGMQAELVVSSAAES